MLDLPISEIPFVFLDTETTGLSPWRDDRIVEIALARFRDGAMENTFQTLLNPGRLIPADAIRIHGISNSAVMDAPTFRQVAAQVSSELDGAVLVGHNMPFDMGFLENEFRLVGMPAPRNLKVDTLKLLREHFDFRSNSLPRVAAAMGISTGGAHRALADVLTTFKVFEYIVEELRPASLGELLDMHGGARQSLPLPPPLEEAIRSKRNLFIRYVDEFGEITERLVTVLDVRAKNEQIRVRAFCHLRDAERSFRLDRMLEMRVEE